MKLCFRLVWEEEEGKEGCTRLLSDATALRHIVYRPVVVGFCTHVWSHRVWSRQPAGGWPLWGVTMSCPRPSDRQQRHPWAQPAPKLQLFGAQPKCKTFMLLHHQLLPLLTHIINGQPINLTDMIWLSELISWIQKNLQAWKLCNKALPGPSGKSLQFWPLNVDLRL